MIVFLSPKYDGFNMCKTSVIEITKKYNIFIESKAITNVTKMDVTLYSNLTLNH